MNLIKKTIQEIGNDNVKLNILLLMILKQFVFSASNLLINAKSVCCLCLLKLIIKTLKCVSIIREIRIRTNFLVHKKMDPSCVKTVTMIMKKMIQETENDNVKLNILLIQYGFYTTCFFCLKFVNKHKKSVLLLSFKTLILLKTLKCVGIHEPLN